MLSVANEQFAYAEFGANLIPLAGAIMDYHQRVIELAEEIDQRDQRLAEIAHIARQEAEKKISLFLGLFAFIWAVNEFGWRGGLAASVVISVAIYLEFRRQDADPQNGQYLIITQAEHEVALRKVAASRKLGEEVWFVEGEAYSGAKAWLAPRRGEDDEDYWRLVYETAGELRRLSPTKRKKRMKLNQREAHDALKEGRAIAEEKGAELPYWVRSALSELESR